MTMTAEVIDGRLEHWARWVREGEAAALGYPPMTILGRLVREGQLIRGPGQGFVPVQDHDTEAELVDRLVARLADVHPLWPEMLRKYYVVGLDAAQVARELGVSRAVVKDRWLGLARQRLAGMLEGLRMVA